MFGALATFMFTARKQGGVIVLDKTHLLFQTQKGIG